MGNNLHPLRVLRKHAVLLISLFITLLALRYFDGSVFLFSILAVILIFGAIIIAWAAEASEVIISEGFALAIVALAQVFPEFMIEATIAWARDLPNMLSNFTGANRILTGVGWPLVFIVASIAHYRRTGKFAGSIQLKEEHSAEVMFFLLATIYSFIIYFRDSITIIDSAVMIAIYISYLLFIFKLPHLSRRKTKGQISGVPALIVKSKKKYFVPIIISMFLLGASMIYFVAEPFYNEALVVAGFFGVSGFLFIQWVAPFLSEFPEKTSAFYWSSKAKKAPMALMNLISSKLTQWTLLLAMIPIVYSISLGALASVPLNSPIAGYDFTVATELLVTIAKSLFAAVFLLKLRFYWFEALSLFVFWIIQFIFVSTRPMMIFIYFGFTILEVLVFRKELKKAPIGFWNIYKKHIISTKK